MPMIRVEMLQGRTIEQKRELVEVLTRETARIATCAVESVQIVITEVDRDNWAVAGAFASQPKKADSSA